MDGMHFPLKKWAVRAIQSHIDTHYIEMMSMNHTTNFNHIMQIAVFSKINIIHLIRNAL